MAASVTATVEILAERVRACHATYTVADPAALEAGAAWYASGRREARRLARLGPPGFGPVRAAAVLAALSPRAQWSVNLRWAERLITSYGAAEPPAVSMRGHRAKAWRILHGADPDRELSGPKVRAFWRNLCGDAEPVTVDVWAARAAGLDERELARRGSYERVAEAYRAVAADVGLAPCDLQGAVWMGIRGAKPTDPQGFRPTGKVE